MNRNSLLSPQLVRCVAIAGIVFGLGLSLPAGDGASGTALPRSEAIARTRTEIGELLNRYGGLPKIREDLEPFRAEVLSEIEAQKNNRQRTFKVGSNDFNKAISTSAIKSEWVHEYDAESGAIVPRDAIIDFDRKLKALGIDLIVIPVPSKIEAYARDFTTKLPPGIPISPGRYEEMRKLLDADIEVVDVLPTLLETLTEDNEIPVYETTGHHISGLGVRHCGALVAERLKRYDLKGCERDRFTDSKRKAGERITPSVPMFAWEVLYDGKPYQHVPFAEVVIIGDSNAFAYRTASWVSHIARCAGVPVTDLSTSSGAATAHIRLAGQGLARLKTRKVVIWVITSTHLERHPWRVTEIPEEPTFMGLLSIGDAEGAVRKYHEYTGDKVELNIRENDLNNLGYELLGEKKFSSAIEIFKINTLEFPLSANTFDSLGEAYMQAGESEKAIANFKKSLSLNPPQVTKENSLKLLKELGVDYTAPAAYALTSAAMEALVGEYSLTDHNKGIVTVENGELVFEFVGQPKMKIEPLSDLLFTTAAGFTATFTTGEDGKARHVVLVGRGMRFEGDRSK